MVEGRKAAVGQLNPFRVNLMGLHNVGLRVLESSSRFESIENTKPAGERVVKKRKAANFFVLLHEATNREV